MSLSETQRDIIERGCALALAAQPSIRVDCRQDAILPDDALAAHVSASALQSLGVFWSFGTPGAS